MKNLKIKIKEAIEGLRKIRRRPSKELTKEQLWAISFVLDYLEEEQELNEEKSIKCSACKRKIEQEKTGEPYLPYKKIILCYDCYLSLIDKIYSMSGAGDGGLIRMFFEDCLKKDK